MMCRFSGACAVVVTVAVTLSRLHPSMYVDYCSTAVFFDLWCFFFASVGVTRAIFG